MGNERDDSEEGEFIELTDLHDLWAWIGFMMGATTQAAFVDMPGDPGRQERSRHAALQLGRLYPAIIAALRVAEAHPEEFWKHCERPIRLQKARP